MLLLFGIIPVCGMGSSRLLAALFFMVISEREMVEAQVVVVEVVPLQAQFGLAANVLVLLFSVMMACWPNERG